MTKQKLENPKFLPEDKIIPLVDIIDELTSIGGDVYGIMHSWFEDSKLGLEVLKDKWSGPIMFYPEIHLFDTSTEEQLLQLQRMNLQKTALI